MTNNFLRQEVATLRQRLAELKGREGDQQSVERCFVRTSNELELRLYERSAELWKVNNILKAQKVRNELVEKNIRYQAYHDPLTGLPNRTLLYDRIAHALAQAERDQRPVALIFLDLDRFKSITDSFGHSMGDRVLQEVSRRLRGLLRKSDTAARLGGDEFAILLPQLVNSEDVGLVAKNVLSSLREPFMLDGHRMQISASLGISLYPHDGSGPDILMKNADVAMYHAKEQGRNNFQYFDAVMNMAAFEKMMLEIALRGALEREELVVYYQPQINMGSWQIVGVEALVRWQHPLLGLITPDQFIPLAEESGLIIPLGKWVLQNVCAQIKAWQDAGYPTLRVTVNLSPRQFQQHDLVEMISAAINEAGLDPALVELEITESVAMENIEGTVEKLNRLSDLGISFSIDDFGTGYSSLSYLKKLPIQTLKIDKSFMQDVTTNYDDAMIVSAVILMAHSLNLKVIAEGVESTEQLDFLLDRKCNEMQGYLFSRPLSADNFAQLFSDNPTYADSFQSIANERARKKALGNC